MNGKILLSAAIAAVLGPGLSAQAASGVYYEIQAQAVSGPGGRMAPAGTHFTNRPALPAVSPSVTTSPLTVNLAVYTSDRGTSAMDLIIPFGPGVGQVRINKTALPPVAQPAAGFLQELVFPSLFGYSGDTTRSQVIKLLNENGKIDGTTYYVTDTTGAPATGDEIMLDMSAGGMQMRSAVQPITVDSDGAFTIPQIGADSGATMLTTTVFATDKKTGMRIGSVFSGLLGADRGSTFTVPLLNDWNTSKPGLNQYGGQLIDADGKPMPGKDFTIIVSGPVGNRYNPIFKVRSGPEGRFRVAFLADEALQNSDMPFIVSARLDGNPRGHLRAQPLKPGYDNIIQEQQVGHVTIELQMPDGRPFDLTTTPALVSGSRSPFNGMLLDSGMAQSQLSLPLTIDDTTSAPTIKPVDIPVPGSYLVMFRGYMFPEQKVERSGDALVFRAQEFPFTMSGRVVSVAGEAIPDAYVLAADPFVLSMVQQPLDRLEVLKNYWDSTGGDFHKLGAYMARTGADGSFKFTGEALQVGGSMLVLAPGYAPMRLHAGPGVVYGMHGERFNVDWESFRIKGSHDLGIIPLAKSATVTLELDAPPEEKSRIMSMSPVRATLLAPMLRNLDDATSSADAATSGPEYRRAWDTKQSYTSGVLTLSVPAETTFSMVLRSSYYFDARPSDSPPTEHRVDIKSPLKPGETRDISGMVDRKLLINP